jgi:hypothetical protein
MVAAAIMVVAAVLVVMVPRHSGSQSSAFPSIYVVWRQT